MTRVPTITRVNGHAESLVWYVAANADPRSILHRDIVTFDAASAPGGGGGATRRHVMEILGPGGAS